LERRAFLTAGGAALLAPLTPPLVAAAPIPEPHFPSRLYQFVWRNWELANADRMAAVAKANANDLVEIGRSMGLPPKPELSSDQLRRIYITTIRQNWHLLPLEQIQQLLGWTREKLEFTLKEDDFLDHKLGPKPDCELVRYSPPSDGEKARAAEIRRLVEGKLGDELNAAGEAPFTFVDRLSSLQFAPARDSRSTAGANEISIEGWKIAGEGPAERRLAAGLDQYLRQAMRARSGGAGTILLRLDSGLSPAGFSIGAEDSQVTVAASDAVSLMQAVYWLQDEMELRAGPFLARGTVQKKASLDPRYLYSYFALYGDPLFEQGIDPFPDGYLEKLGRVGINGVWMQCVLNTMAPSSTFPEFGRGAEQRLRNLATLVERAAQFGLKIYLYINEPRSMPAEFYRTRPEMRGAEDRGRFAMCTSVAAVREWISASLAHIFERVPELGGVFSITMSENLTNCFSHFHPERCSRCSKRTNWDVVGEVLEAIRSGVRRASKTAEVIAWDWGWPAELCRNLIPRLPRDMRYLSVSEWSTPIERGGVRTEVGEYSISVVGPGPRATANWKAAASAGVRTMAKTQFNNTWEISAVPFIPVADLVARHCENLLRSGVSGIMASWTLGGYPSPNLEVAKEFYFSPSAGRSEVLRRVAERRYGRAAAPLALEAWKGFSEAFELYPYGVAIYTIPTQHGPANLLRPAPSGVRSSMILFPQDDYRNWAGKYPPEIAQRQFARMADRWEAALPLLRKAVDRVPVEKRQKAQEDLAIAEVCYLHFRSTANQIEFYLLRDAPANASGLARMRAIASAEIELCRRLYPLARRHSVIAYEASNHYYYRPADLLEKIVNCQYLLDHELRPAP